MEAVVLPGLRSVGARSARRWSGRELTEPPLVLSAPKPPCAFS